MNIFAKMTVLTLTIFVATLNASEEKPARPKSLSDYEPNFVLATLGDKQITVEKAQAMVASGMSSDLTSAISRWISIHASANEARKLNLDKEKNIVYMLELVPEIYLADALKANIARTVPPITEEIAKKYYFENISKYLRPMNVAIRHIRTMERKTADLVLKMARQGEDFATLAKTYSEAEDAPRGGLLRNLMEKQIMYRFSSEIATAVKNSKQGDIIGPFIGKSGFEVIQITTMIPDKPHPFEKVKRRIENQLYKENLKNAKETALEDVKKDSGYVKAPELIVYEKYVIDKIVESKAAEMREAGVSKQEIADVQVKERARLMKLYGYQE